MRFILATMLSVFSFSAFANCKVYIPVKHFDNSGYTINFDFTKILHEKNYQEVDSAEAADLLINLDGLEQEGRFHHAVALIEMGSYKALESVTCYTQFCGISDFAKAFKKSYKKFSRLIPICE